MNANAKRLKVRQADIARAVKGVASAGVAVGGVEIDPATGRIVVLAKDSGGGLSPALPLDQWLSKRHAHQA